MTDDSDRQRVLEERIAGLEARLHRLEAVAGVDPGISLQPEMASEPPSPIVPVAPLPRVSAWVPAAADQRQELGDRAEPMPGWVTYEPAFRLPPRLRLPDMSGSLTEIEARLTGQTLAWVGGLALVLGAIFFLSLAFSRGWIGPELRVLIGLAAGSIAIAGGAFFMERGNRLLGHVLTPVGLATI